MRQPCPGGLFEFHAKFPEMLEDRGHRVAAHAWGAGGSLMQNVHAGFCPAEHVHAGSASGLCRLRPDLIDGGLAW